MSRSFCRNLCGLGIVGLLQGSQWHPAFPLFQPALEAYAYHQSQLRSAAEGDLRACGQGDNTPILLGGLVDGRLLYDHAYERTCDDIILVAHGAISAEMIEHNLLSRGFERRSVAQRDSSIRDTVYCEKSFSYDVPPGMAAGYQVLHRAAPTYYNPDGCGSALCMPGTVRCEVRDSLFLYRDNRRTRIDDEDTGVVAGLESCSTLRPGAAVPYLAAQMLLYVATEPTRSARIIGDLIRSLERLDPEDVGCVMQNAGKWGTFGYLKSALEGILDYVPSLDLEGLSPAGRDLVSGVSDYAMGLGGLRFGILTVLNRVQPGKLLYHEAMLEHEALEGFLCESDQIATLAAVGSYARCDEVVDSLDYVVASEEFGRVLKRMPAFHRVTAVLNKTDTHLSVKLQSGATLTICAVPSQSVPVVVLHRSLEAEDWQFLEARAKERSLVLGRESLTRDGVAMVCEDTADVFRALDLRPGSGRARSGRRNDLRFSAGGGEEGCETDDLKGFIHVHTPYSDGVSSIDDLVRTACEGGYRFIGLSDHNHGERFRSTFLKEEEVTAFFEAVERIQQKYPDISILRGIECDIRADGTMAMGDDTLARFDFVIAAIHYADPQAPLSSFERILRAIQNPFVNVVAHASGRMLLTHPDYASEGIGARGYEVRWNELIRACKEQHVLLECNVAPHRLDVDKQVAAAILETGMPLLMCPDAHSVRHFDYMRSGFRILQSVVRRPSDLMNCWEADQVMEFFRGQRRKKRAVA